MVGQIECTVDELKALVSSLASCVGDSPSEAVIQTQSFADTNPYRNDDATHNSVRIANKRADDLAQLVEKLGHFEA
jgi:hypothetical protein